MSNIALAVCVPPASPKSMTSSCAERLSSLSIVFLLLITVTVPTRMIAAEKFSHVRSLQFDCNCSVRPSEQWMFVGRLDSAYVRTLTFMPSSSKAGALIKAVKMARLVDQNTECELLRMVEQWRAFQATPHEV